MKKCVLIVTAFILTMAGACLAQSDQTPSLAALAVKKKPAKKAVLRLSDEDLPPPSALPSADGPAAASSESSAAAANKAKAADKQVSKGSEKGQTAEQRTNELKEKLARYQKEEDVWKQSSKHYEELIANEPSEFRRQMYQDSLANDKQNAALYQRQIDDIQNELAKPQQKADTSSHSNSAPGGSQP